MLIAMPNWLEGRHALITGGGTGIGASCATHLNAAGAKVTVLGRRAEPLEFIRNILNGTAVQADVTDRAQIDRAFGEARAANGPIAVIAAGEQWSDGSLRPSFEDLVGAGAVLTAIGAQRPSPEAVTAMAAFDSIAGDLGAALRACASARELAAMGFPDDVRIAGELDASDTVPELQGRSFVDVNVNQPRGGR